MIRHLTILVILCKLGCWYMVKRWLPSSGRYALNEYLPLFMWMRDCKRKKVDPFWELCDLVANSKCKDNIENPTEDEDVDHEEEVASQYEESFGEAPAVCTNFDIEDDNLLRFPCTGCGIVLNSLNLLKEHINKCDEF